MGNICRSPTAEAVLAKKLADQNLHEKIKVDSAGTHNFHPDSPPDKRSQLHAFKRFRSEQNGNRNVFHRIQLSARSGLRFLLPLE